MSKIDDMLNDPDFLKLPEQDQYDLIDELRQSDFSKPPTHENLLQKAIRNSAVNFSVAGLPAAMNPNENPEDALPMVAQAGADSMFDLSPEGRAAGLIPGLKYGATVGATTAAEGMRQTAKGLKGGKADYGEVGKTAAETAGIEGLFRGGENVLFKSQIGRDAIKGAKGRLGGALTNLGKIVDRNPGLKVMRDDILGYVDHAMTNVPPVGPQSSALRKLRGFLTRMPDELGVGELSNLENAFGGVAEYRPEKGGMIKNKAADVAAKRSRGHISGMLDTMGEYAGVPIKETSKEASTAQKIYGQKKPGFGAALSKKVGLPALVGGAYGYHEKNPMAGFLAAGATALGQSEPLRNLLYQLIVKSGASKAGRVGISEVARRAD